MVWDVISVVAWVLFVAVLVALFSIEQKQNRISTFQHEREFPDKWIVGQDCTMLIRVRGDFWIERGSKGEDGSYFVVCGNKRIANYPHECYCKQLLTEIARFMFDDDKKVFIVDPHKISRFDCAVERANSSS